jgi:condensin-2 complex subunit D3
LSLVSDVESSISEKSLELIDSLILKKINEETAWKALSLVETDVIALLKGVIRVLHTKKSLNASIVKHIQERLKISPSVNGWMILDEVSSFYPKSIDSKFILQEENEQSLSILSKISSNLPAKDANQLADRIFENLNSFNVSSNLIHSYISILITVNTNVNFSSLINDCLDKLHKIVVDKEKYDEASLSKYLTTVGELMSITTLPKRMITLVQALVTDKLDISAQSKAHAFITLGKMCLCDSPIAKQSIPLFVTELEKAKDEIVKNNILIIMCDLCVKYTSLVDRYIDKISESINDESSLVRRTAAVLLTQLLAEDFIKWRPSLLFRFIAILSDENEKVSGAAEYSISLLTRKNQNLLFNNFIESIFVLNGVKHETFNKLNIQLKLEGNENQKKRFLIYQCLLQKLTTDQKLKIHGRFHTDVLLGFAEGEAPINKYLVSDILKILSSRDMRFNKTSAAAADEPVENEEENVKGKLMIKILNKHISENVIPVIVELKRTLEKQRSPLTKNLMEYLRLIMNDYKSEMKDVFAADNQLAKEIEFDLRQLKMDKKFTYQSPFKSPMKSPFKVNSMEEEFKSPITPKRSAPKLSATPRKEGEENLAKQLFVDEEVNNKKRKHL